MVKVIVGKKNILEKRAMDVDERRRRVMKIGLDRRVYDGIPVAEFRKILARLPGDSEIVGLTMSYERDTLDVAIRSQEFKIVPDGNCVPRINNILKDNKLILDWGQYEEK